MKKIFLMIFFLNFASTKSCFASSQELTGNSGSVYAAGLQERAAQEQARLRLNQNMAPPIQKSAHEDAAMGQAAAMLAQPRADVEMVHSSQQPTTAHRVQAADPSSQDMITDSSSQTMVVVPTADASATAHAVITRKARERVERERNIRASIQLARQKEAAQQEEARKQAKDQADKIALQNWAIAIYNDNLMRALNPPVALVSNPKVLGNVTISEPQWEPADVRCAKDPNQKLTRAVRYYKGRFNLTGQPQSRPNADKEINEALRDGADPRRGIWGRFQEFKDESINTSRALMDDMNRPEAFALFQFLYEKMDKDARLKDITEKKLMDVFLKGLVQARANKHQANKGDLNAQEEEFWLKYMKLLVGWGADVNSISGPTVDLESAENKKKLENAKAWSHITHNEIMLDLRGYENRLLHIAAKFGLKETVKLLVESGAIIDVQNIVGLTPIDYAEKRGFFEIARYLRNQLFERTAKKEMGLVQKKQMDLKAASAPTAMDLVTPSAQAGNNKTAHCALDKNFMKVMQRAIDLQPQFDQKAEQLKRISQELETLAADEQGSLDKKFLEEDAIRDESLAVSAKILEEVDRAYILIRDQVQKVWMPRFVRGIASHFYINQDSTDTYQEKIEYINWYAFNTFREIEEICHYFFKSQDPRFKQFLIDMFWDNQAYKKYKNISGAKPNAQGRLESFTEEKPLLYYIFSYEYYTDPRIFQKVREWVPWDDKLYPLLIEIIAHRLRNIRDLIWHKRDVDVPIIIENIIMVKYIILLFKEWGNLSEKELNSIFLIPLIQSLMQSIDGSLYQKASKNNLFQFIIDQLLINQAHASPYFAKKVFLKQFSDTLSSQFTKEPARLIQSFLVDRQKLDEVDINFAKAISDYPIKIIMPIVLRSFISDNEQQDLRKEKFEHLAFDKNELALKLNNPIAAQNHIATVEARNAWIEAVLRHLKNWDIEAHTFDKHLKELINQFNNAWFVQTEVNKLWPILESINNGNPQTSAYWNSCAELFMALQNSVIDPLYKKSPVPRYFYGWQ